MPRSFRLMNYAFSKPQDSTEPGHDRLPKTDTSVDLNKSPGQSMLLVQPTSNSKRDPGFNNPNKTNPKEE